jgi:hypothetical protein
LSEKEVKFIEKLYVEIFEWIFIQQISFNASEYRNVVGIGP